MSTYPAAEGLQVDDRLASIGPQEKILAPPTLMVMQEGVLEKNDKMPMEYGDREPIKEKRYCGLSPKRFWVVFVIVLVAIIAGAIGGGVGGALAGKSAMEGADNLISSSPPILTNAIIPPSITSPTPTDTITALSITSSTSTSPTPTNTITALSITSSTSIPPTPTPSCPPNLSCSNIACLGSDSRCISGIYAQCPCTTTCPSTPPPCPKCNGSSATLLCGPGDFLGCACKSVCGAIDGPCRNCAGKSDPNGGRGVCTSLGVRGCFCASECGRVNGPCDKNGCFGDNGFCTQGTVWGCACG